jgi:hypothetical protein
MLSVKADAREEIDSDKTPKSMKINEHRFRQEENFQIE